MKTTRTAVLTMTGLSALALLSGCAATGSASSSTPTSGTGSTADAGSTSGSSGSSSTGSTGSSSSKYKDGTYTEQGSYSSPGGQETIAVTLQLADDTVKSVTVKSVKSDPTGASYQAKFIGGISDVVVGKAIDDLQVSHVAGSSLTSKGFNSAVATIKTDAAS